MPRRIAVLLLLSAACSAGDAGTGPGGHGSDALARLAECPRGDRAWRAALDGASEPSELERLGQAVRELAAGACEGRWEASWAVGETLFRRGLPSQAHNAYDLALELAERESSPEGVACTANRLGTIEYYAGAPEAAEKDFRHALAAARTAGREDLEAFVLNNLAGLLKEEGRLAEASRVFSGAAERLAELGLDKPARDAAYNRGVLLLSLGALEPARRLLDRVEREARAAGDSEIDALVDIAYGQLHLSRGELSSAEERFRRVPQSPAQLAVSRALGLGRVALEEGDLTLARQNFSRAAERAAAAGIAIDELLARAYSGRALLAAGELPAARRELLQVVRRAEQAGSREYVAWLAHWSLGQLAEEEGDLDDAIGEYEEAVRRIEQQAGALDPLGGGMHFLMERADPYTSLALALERREREGGGASGAAAVLSAVERAHARALRRVLTGREMAPPRADLEQIVASLRPGEVLLDFLLAPDQGLLVVVDDHGGHVERIAGWNEVAGPANRWRRALSRAPQSLGARLRPRAQLAAALPAARRLSRDLLAPACDVLRGARSLYIVPDRSLALLPFAAMPDPCSPADPAAENAGFLGRRLDVALMPLAAPVPRPGPPYSPLLLAGDPLPGDDTAFPRLLHAREELDALTALWPTGDRREVSGSRFLPDVFREPDISRYRTLHLATHAVASTLDPQDCAVIFSHGRRLGFDEIAHLRLGPTLVVLSACRSGEGEMIPGEGVVGLSWAFLGAGARCVIASLWPVDDSSTAEMMARMHRRLRAGATPLQALGAAAREESRHRPHPGFWGPFIAVLRPDSRLERAAQGHTPPRSASR